MTIIKAGMKLIKRKKTFTIKRGVILIVMNFSVNS